MSSRIRVMVVDDSAIVRRLLTELLNSQPDLEVSATAPDPLVALDKIKISPPDVITLDLEMPRMDGITFLKQLMQTNPLPVVVISSLCERGSRVALEALQVGAVEVLAKPDGPYSVSALKGDLAAKIRAAALAKGRLANRVRSMASMVARPAAKAGAATAGATTAPFTAASLDVASQYLITIGASTGGTEAIFQVLSHLPADHVPGIVITQHIPAYFSRAFAERMNAHTPFEVKEAQTGELILPGRVMIAPGDYHLLVERVAGRYRTLVKQGPPVAFQRPSVDVLFHSVAEAAGAHAIGVILTGMGNDGAGGMKHLHEKGAYTIAQDEASSVIFGMPREAIRLGVVDKVASLEHIPAVIAAAVEAKLKRVA